MKTLTLLLLLVTAAVAKDKPREVTISVISSNVYCCDEIKRQGGVLDGLNNTYSALYSLDVTVSDDPGKVYSISCFMYHTWDHCEIREKDKKTTGMLPFATSYAAKITGNKMRIIYNPKYTGVKYNIDHIREAGGPQ